jgi:hypothetical protein
MTPMRFVPSLAILAVAAGVSAQTIEERAAQVRQSLEDRAADVRRTMESPAPVEAAIDRGTRVVQPPAAAPQTSAVAPPAESMPSGQVAVPVSPEVNERMNRLLTRSTPGLRVDQTDAGGAGVTDPSGVPRPGAPGNFGSVGLREFPPGVLVIRGANGGQGTGVSNLVTGRGTTPAAAP